MTINDTPDDPGGYVTEDDDGAYSPICTNLSDTIKSSARRQILTLLLYQLTYSLQLLH